MTPSNRRRRKRFACARERFIKISVQISHVTLFVMAVAWARHRTKNRVDSDGVSSETPADVEAGVRGIRPLMRHTARAEEINRALSFKRKYVLISAGPSPLSLSRGKRGAFVMSPFLHWSKQSRGQE